MLFMPRVFLQRYPDVMGHFDQLYLSHEVGFRKPEGRCVQTGLWVDANRSSASHLSRRQQRKTSRGAQAAGLTAFLTRGEKEVLKVLHTLY